MKTKKSRINIICIRCEKEKQHFGMNMCSVCLRRTKRETRPNFYLGTCYSEMSRRVKTFDPERPNYYKRSICTKKEFINKFLTDISFLKLYKKWQNNNFQRKHSPTIDRIDNNKDYIISNLRFISHFENTGKDSRIPIILKNDKEELYFKSCRDACLFLKIQTPYFCKIRKNKGHYKGYDIYEAT